MDRFLVKAKAGQRHYEILDDKTNIVIATFLDLWRAQEYSDYINKREELKILLLKQISDEVDEEFK